MNRAINLQTHNGNLAFRPRIASAQEECTVIVYNCHGDR